MRFRIHILLLIFCCLGSVAASAQDIRKSMSLQDLVGEWELVPNDKGMRVGEKLESGLLRVTIRDMEVKIFRQLDGPDGTTERTFIFFADGRGETNRWIGEDGKTVINRKTKTTWKKGILISKWNYKTNFGWMDVEDKYNLADDLLKLEYEQVQQGAGPFSRGFYGRMIFRRL